MIILGISFVSHTDAGDRSERNTMLLRLRDCLAELRAGEWVDAHAALYGKYFVKTEDKGGKVSFDYNDEAIRKAADRHSGFLCLLTDDTRMDAQKALSLYRDKDGVEKVFGDLRVRFFPGCLPVDPQGVRGPADGHPHTPGVRDARQYAGIPVIVRGVRDAPAAGELPRVVDAGVPPEVCGCGVRRRERREEYVVCDTKEIPKMINRIPHFDPSLGEG